MQTRKNNIQLPIAPFAILASLLVILSVASMLQIISPSKAHATDLSGFRAGKIIDDGVFTNKDSLSTAAIQNFLNSKVPVCDTWGTQPSEYGGGTRAQYGASKGYSTPFTCLKDYSENNKSAAQIIYEAAQTYQINPKVLIVLLQKEQGLITDTWPFSVQYRSATGYGCPDTAACDSQYYGLTNQLNWAAKMFRAIMNNSPTWYTPYVLGSNYIQYNPTSSCGGSNVTIENRATQALYNYTPYQPNQATLNAGWGTAPCGAYGNRNFYLYFTEWFGSAQTNTPYGWGLVEANSFIDTGRTRPLTGKALNLQPGQTAYIRVKSLNTGYQNWDKSIVHLGTTSPHDRNSPFANGSWLSGNRIEMVENSVTPGQVGTFLFEFKAPSAPGIYYEELSLVADGISWMNNPGMKFTISVTPTQEPSNTLKTTLPSGEALAVGEYLLSPDSQSVLRLQENGRLDLISAYENTWSSNTSGGIRGLYMQPDGNLVIYNSSGQPVWNSETGGHPGAFLALQPDGNLVIYHNGSALWSSATVSTPDYLSRVEYTLRNTILYPGQSLLTPDHKYRMVLQWDGNLVIYSPSRAIWASGTSGRQAKQLNMQPDGNLVIYDTQGQAIWNTRTSGNGPSTLAMQPDGNLVIYSATRSTWDSGTRGKD